LSVRKYGKNHVESTAKAQRTQWNVLYLTNKR
jgi:hypothetical protein